MILDGSWRCGVISYVAQGTMSTKPFTPWRRRGNSLSRRMSQQISKARCVNFSGGQRPCGTSKSRPFHWNQELGELGLGSDMVRWFRWFSWACFMWNATHLVGACLRFCKKPPLQTGLADTQKLWQDWYSLAICTLAFRTILGPGRRVPHIECCRWESDGPTGHSYPSFASNCFVIRLNS